MTSRRSPTEGGRTEVFASIQDQMERAEARRRRAVRLAAGLATSGLLVTALAVAVALASGEPSAPESAVPTSDTPAVTTPKSQPNTTLAQNLESAEPPAADPKPDEPSVVEPRREKSSTSAPVIQRLKLAIGAVGYEPSVLSAKAGIPIRLTVERGEGCAAGFLIPEIGVEVDNSAADVSVELGELEPGDYRFTCGMEMVEGVLEVR